MSSQILRLVITKVEQVADNRTYYRVRFLPATGAFPEIHLNVTHEIINKYSERYLANGLVLDGVNDAITAKILMVGLVKVASMLHAGRQSFCDQGFEKDVVATVPGLQEITYEARGFPTIRLASTPYAAEVEKELNALGIELQCELEEVAHA